MGSPMLTSVLAIASKVSSVFSLLLKSVRIVHQLLVHYPTYDLYDLVADSKSVVVAVFFNDQFCDFVVL